MSPNEAQKRILRAVLVRDANLAEGRQKTILRDALRSTQQKQRQPRAAR